MLGLSLIQVKELESGVQPVGDAPVSEPHDGFLSANSPTHHRLHQTLPLILQFAKLLNFPNSHIRVTNNI